MKTKTLSLILSLICLFTLITGCDGIGLEDIHLNLGVMIPIPMILPKRLDAS